MSDDCKPLTTAEIKRLASIVCLHNKRYGTPGTCIFSGKSKCEYNCANQGLCMDKDNLFIIKMREEQKILLNPHHYCIEIYTGAPGLEFFHTNECLSRMKVENNCRVPISKIKLPQKNSARSYVDSDGTPTKYSKEKEDSHIH